MTKHFLFLKKCRILPPPTPTPKCIEFRLMYFVRILLLTWQLRQIGYETTCLTRHRPLTLQAAPGGSGGDAPAERSGGQLGVVTPARTKPIVPPKRLLRVLDHTARYVAAGGCHLKLTKLVSNVSRLHFLTNVDFSMCVHCSGVTSTAIFYLSKSKLLSPKSYSSKSKTTFFKKLLK